MSDPVIRPAPAGPLARLLLDLGPLVLFFVAYTRANIFVATLVFMLAMATTIAISHFRYRHVSPVLWFSGFMVLVLGGLTLWLHNETFIKMKPTVYYSAIAALLGYGALVGKPMLKSVFGEAWPDLDARGWDLLGRNFAIFFALMAIANELVWRTNTTAFWLGYKIWGAIPLTLLFGLANVPMIGRHSHPPQL